MRHSLVLAMLPASRLQRLRTAAPDLYAVVSARTWADAVEVIRVRPVEMVVVDPFFEGRSRIYEIERLRFLFPSLPLLVYAALAPEVAGVLLQLGRLNIRRALFERFDDAPASLRLALKGELEQSAPRRVMQALEQRLAGLPERLRWALDAMVHAPTEAATVSALAQRANLTRRTCERAFLRAGLPSPRSLMGLVRALYAHRLLLDPGYTVEDVAQRLGFGRAKALQNCLRDVFGCTAGDLRASLSFEDGIAMVTSRHLAVAERRVAS